MPSKQDPRVRDVKGVKEGVRYYSLLYFTRGSIQIISPALIDSFFSVDLTRSYVDQEELTLREHIGKTGPCSC